MEEKKIKCLGCKREFYSLSDEQDYKLVDKAELCKECLNKVAELVNDLEQEHQQDYADIVVENTLHPEDFKNN